MTATLYYAPSTAALVVHWLLIEFDVPHRLLALDFEAREQKSEAYLKLNPAGVVPTLILDGQVLTEAAAIAVHLTDLYPDAGLAPVLGTAARADYYRWMFYCANTLQPAFRAWFYPHEPAGEEHAEAVREQARKKLEGAWDYLSSRLEAGGPYLLGHKPSTADFMMTMMMRWSRNMPRPSDDWPALQTYARLMKDRPAYAEACRREGVSDWL